MIAHKKFYEQHTGFCLFIYISIMCIIFHILSNKNSRDKFRINSVIFMTEKKRVVTK